MLLELLLAAYGTWPKSELGVPAIDHLRWKLESGIEPYRAAVVEHDGIFVGGVLTSFRELVLQGQAVMGAGGGDVAVHPDYQGQGVFSAMTPFLFDINIKFDLSYGYRSRHAAVRRAVEPYHRQVFGNFINVFAASTPLPASPGGTGSPTITSITSFDERADTLWREAVPAFDFIGDRGQAHLNWRFCDRRAGDYTVFGAEDSGRLLGYAVARTSYGRGYLVDLLVQPGRVDLATALARRALEGLQNVEEVECWLPSRHPYFDALAAAGFATVRTTQDVTYRHMRIPDEDLDFLREPSASVHFTLGDTDLV
jgi:GNAT superfamily N-acetyltransferase